MTDRLCALDIDIDRKKMRLICVYMPRSRHRDIQVEEIYTLMIELCRSGKKLRRHCLIFGDVNAVVGKFTDYDKGDVLGKYGLGSRNECGQRLLDWATFITYSLINTTSQKPDSKLWTHCRGNIKRQIDSDHRCLKVDLEISKRNGPSETQQPSQPDRLDGVKCIRISMT